MTDLSKNDDLNLLLMNINSYCERAVETGDTGAIRELSRELICCLNRADRRLLEKEPHQ